MGTATQSQSSVTTEQVPPGSPDQRQQLGNDLDFSKSIEQQISQAIQPVLDEFRQQMAHTMEQQIQAESVTNTAGGLAAPEVQAAPTIPQPAAASEAQATPSAPQQPTPPAAPSPLAQPAQLAGETAAQAAHVVQDQQGTQHLLTGTLRPALQVMEHQAEQWLQSLLVAALGALLAESTRSAIQQRADQGLHILLQKTFEALPQSSNSKELQAQTERTLQSILRDSLEAVFTQARLPATQQQGEQALRESLHGNFAAALKSIEDTVKALFEALVAVLREQWQRVLRLLLRALLVVLEGSLEKSLAS